MFGRQVFFEGKNGIEVENVDKFPNFVSFQESIAVIIKGIKDGPIKEFHGVGRFLSDALVKGGKFFDCGFTVRVVIVLIIFVVIVVVLYELLFGHPKGCITSYAAAFFFG